jgi:hypothetical protein
LIARFCQDFGVPPRRDIGMTLAVLLDGSPPHIQDRLLNVTRGILICGQSSDTQPNGQPGQILHVHNIGFLTQSADQLYKQVPNTVVRMPKTKPCSEGAQSG